jgi:enamine deaminase RidA (YjgF/YER057c/UK114 family)
MGDSMRDVISAPAPGLDLGREYGHHQSPAIRAGGLIFCSGMVAINPESGEREHGTVTSEVRRIFENLKLLLQAAGSSLRLRGNRRHQVSQWTPCRSERDSNPGPPQDK